MEKKKAIAKICLISILTALLIVFSIISFMPANSSKGYAGFTGAITKGLDLDGGIYANYAAERAEGIADEEFNERLNLTYQRVQGLISEKGYEDARVYLTSDNKIRIESPNVDDANEILTLIGSGELKIRATADSTAEVKLSGKDVTAAFAMQDPTTYYWGTYVAFNAEGAAKLSELTESAGSSKVNLYFYRGDSTNYFFTLPVSSQISVQDDGTGFLFISSSNGTMTQDSAVALAIQISTGSYKTILTVDGNAVQSITASSGEESLLGLTIASGVAALLILLVLALIYRELGLICGVSILLFIGSALFFMQAVPIITLSLASLGGAFVGLMLVVACHVIMLEKIKAEYAVGKKLKTAIKAGYKKSIAVICEICGATAIITFACFFICTGALKSFCMVLMICSLLSLLITLFFTYHMTKSYAEFNSNNAKRVNFTREDEVNEIE